jgi:hypothetical protein
VAFKVTFPDSDEASAGVSVGLEAGAQATNRLTKITLTINRYVHFLISTFLLISQSEDDCERNQYKPVLLLFGHPLSKHPKGQEELSLK